jgi:carbon storage regulator
MLVLTRKVGETIVVPSCGLTVQVLAVQGDKIRLGFTAPRETQIHRAEVWERILQNEEQESMVGPAH